MSEQVSIITTTHRAYDKLQKCLHSVLENTKFVDYKHYVWCNDPDDRVKQIVHDAMFIDDILYNDLIEPIYNDSNDGSFASNNNEAAKEAQGKYLLFLNDDIIALQDSWLYNMVQILETDEKVGAVGALLLYPDNKTIQHCGVFFSSKTNSMPYHMFYKQPLENVAGFVSQARYYQVVTGACLLVRKSDFEAVGGFCEEYFYCFEDVDLCLSIRNKLGKSSVFCPDAKLIHDEGISGTRPKLEHNIGVFRKRCTGKHFNDLEFYLNNANHMLYRRK